ncbi:DExH-box splicing factor binding site-domain-containing protein [Parasitella parasitica]|nr:DExH-box splicing factor binding site-domain-containing protein [Parasitella parasitica]
MSSRLPLQSRAVRPKFQNKRAIFGDDENEEEKIKDERILGIEDNKVKEAEPKKEAASLSISPLPNVNWRSNAKQKKEMFLPATAKQPSNGSDGSKPEILQQNESSFGLQIQKKRQIETVDIDGHVESISVEETTLDKIPTKTLEEKAIEAIIKDSMGEGEDDKDQGPKKVIQVDETSAFRDDYEQRPDETTMEDYENIPVEEFGAALLRGLGWNEGQGIGKNRKNAPAPPPAPVKQREALLGLGAKPEDVDSNIDERQKFKNRRAAYEYKDTSLFKKISKRKYEDEDDRSSSRHSRRDRDKDRSRDRGRDRGRSNRRDHDDKSRSKRRSRSADRDSSTSSKSYQTSHSHSSSRHRRHSYSRSRSPVSRSSRK